MPSGKYRRFFSIAAALLSALSVLTGCHTVETVLPSDNLAPMEAEADAEQLRAIIDPASEVRGVYIASTYNIDFPSKPDLSAKELRAELDAILDTVEAAGLNTVYFQVRPTCDALYQSELFPVSETLSSTGKLTVDPLAYLIKEAHSRNIFVHAWVNPLRVTNGSAAKPNTDVTTLSEDSPARQNPDWVVAYADGRLYFDPGIPEVRTLVAAGVQEIVENYDVDGVIFDDYFYPYPATNDSGAPAAFDDADSYALYGGEMSLADWRRDNINQLVKACYQAVKNVREDALFGVAPFGIWKNDNGSNGGSATKGLQSYSSIYCDPVAWAEGGYVDYLAPQLYWRFTTSAAPYDELVRFWNRVLDGTGVNLLISHAAYQYDGWSDPAGEIAKQVQYARSELCYRGSIFYGYEEICHNTAGLTEELREIYASPILYTDPSPTGMAPAISSPANGSYINASYTYLLGSSSPDEPLTLNGEKISRTRGGYFSTYVELAPGENVFVLTQNGVSVTYTVYRGTAPSSDKPDAQPSGEFTVSSVSPAKNVLLESGGTLTVSCKAPAGVRVTVQLGDSTVQMEQTEDVTALDSGWAAATYSARIALPVVGNDEILSLGALQITATAGEQTAEAAGAAVRVRGKNAYIPVRVTEDHTELKLGFNTYYYNDFSVQSAGMTDRAVWQGNGMYLLRVGGYVYEDSVVELTAEETVPIAQLDGVRIYSDGENTLLDFGLDQNVPHNGTLQDDCFALTLYNVDVSTVPDTITVEKNPLIESVSVVYPKKANCVRFLCKLFDVENFYGFDFQYTENGAQAILTNPRVLDLSSDTPLSGVTIVLDAGHGGAEPGARGPLYTDSVAITEKDLNLSVTLAAAEKLRALGAEVILTREDDTTVPIQDRITFLCDVMPDLSISIHHNSVDYSVDARLVGGTLGLWWAESGVLLTRCISSSVAEALFRQEIEPKQQMLALCRNPKFPSTLVEVGFMTSVEEFEFMLNGGVERAAEGIANGVLLYFAEQAKWAVQ